MTNPDALVVAISVVAVILADGKSDEEIALMSTVFSQLGDTMATITSARDYFKTLDKNDNKDNGGDKSGEVKTSD